jgi:hypothetical protein
MFKLKLVTVFAGIFLLASCQSQDSLESQDKTTAKTDVEARNIATLHRYWNELLNGRDTSKAHEIIAPDFTLYVRGEPTRLKGVDIFIEMYKMHDSEGALSKNEFFEDEIVAAGNTIASRWHGTAIHDKVAVGYKPIPNDQKITWQGMCFYHFDENGLMIDGHVVPNVYEILEMRERAANQADQD